MSETKKRKLTPEQIDGAIAMLRRKAALEYGTEGYLTETAAQYALGAQLAEFGAKWVPPLLDCIRDALLSLDPNEETDWAKHARQLIAPLEKQVES